MIPSAANSDYPKFVADQVLTSDNLNDLFGYLDEQGRITRTNLSGIGIVCGLKVKTAADGSGITITKGVGVTSSGYLVSVPEITYTKRTTDIFNAVTCDYYNKFVDIETKTQKFNLWELKQEAETTGTTLLNNTFITEGSKIVLMFVELLEENNKNCDPNSCDDKGVKVTVNFRSLLIEMANVGTLLNGAGAPANPWLALPDIAMKRFDVRATPIFECLNFFQAYQKILSNAFLIKLQIALTQSHGALQTLLPGEFTINPFATLANDFKFLADGSITSDQLLAMQYYYDLFSDILLAYNELKKTGAAVIGMCCPDDIFPRHLLLDLAKPAAAVETINYRHYFIPSPILSDQQKTVVRLKILFKKLTLLVQKFAVPPYEIKGINKLTDKNIRITPSKLANVDLSEKSIPYYYAINLPGDSLLSNWNAEKSLQGKTDRNLSYHAIKYNFTNDEIRQPLLYDLEPYNFLRIEGHIGKPYKHVVKNITSLRDGNRLPFDIVALNADFLSIKAFMQNLGKLFTTTDATTQATLEELMGMSCQFNDLELLYDSIMAELTGKLSNEMKFFYGLSRDKSRKPLPKPTSNDPQVPLLKKTDPVFNFIPDSLGHEFELFYQTVKNQPFIPINVFFQSFGQGGNTDLMDFVFKAILYYIEMIYETITTGLSNFKFSDFYIRYYSLIQSVRFIKGLNLAFKERFPLSEEENDHLDALLSITADSRMVKLYTEFLRRILHVKIIQLAGYYANTHAGIQHKAGVPMGGTFILVYHETDKAEEEEDEEKTPAANIAAAAAGNRGDAAGKEIKSGTSFIKMAGSSFRSKTAPVMMKLKEDASPQEHLEVMSAEVSEKVASAKNRIIAGVEKAVDADAVRAEKIKSVSGNGKAAATRPSAAAATEASAKNSNEAVLNYLKEAATYFKARPASPLDEVIEDFDDGVVIADFYLPYSCCSDCPPVQMIVVGETEKPNQPPVARPGDNISLQLPTNAVNLDGSTSSDPDGTIKSYLWEKQSGPDAVIESASASKTKVSKLTEGEYVFKLTVIDDDESTDSATVQVTVLPAPNLPPVARATAKDPVLILGNNNTATTALDGSGSKDPDGSIKSFSWSLSSGTASGAVIRSEKKEITEVIFTRPGTYVFKLVVTDNKDATDTAAVTVIIREKENQPPVARAVINPTAVTLSQNNTADAELIGSESKDPDGDPLLFQWSLAAGLSSGAIIKSPEKELTSVTFTQAGTYMFKLAVTDSKGATDATTVSITVNPRENKAPVAKAAASPATLVIPPSGAATRTQLNSQGSADPDGDLISFRWSLPATVAGASIQNPNAAVTDVVFSAPGNYVFTLTVTDSRGGVGTATVTVIVTVVVVQNQPPVARATATPAVIIMNPILATRVQLDGSTSSDPENNRLTFLWSLPLGTTGANITAPAEAKTVVQFTKLGRYDFTLTVSDGNKTSQATVTVEVRPRLL